MTGEGQLLTDIILRVFRLNGLLIQAGDEMGAEFGLTSARWKVLGALAYGSQPMTVPQIAGTMGLSRQAVQRLVHDMAEGGLLQGIDNPEHKKSPLWRLSPAGRQTFDRIMQRQARWVDALAQNMDRDALRKTASTLEMCSTRLEQTKRARRG
ncbi:MarR family transcriptional regulator [Algiphilus sp.]